MKYPCVSCFPIQPTKKHRIPQMNINMKIIDRRWCYDAQKDDFSLLLSLSQSPSFLWNTSYVKQNSCSWLCGFVPNTTRSKFYYLNIEKTAKKANPLTFLRVTQCKWKFCEHYCFLFWEPSLSLLKSSYCLTPPLLDFPSSSDKLETYRIDWVYRFLHRYWAC